MPDLTISDDPAKFGTVVRIDNPQAKYPEVWIASHINGGLWYPDLETWSTSAALRRDHPQGIDFYDLAKRGTVTLLSSGAPETYEAGWRAACQVIRQATDDTEWSCPGMLDDDPREDTDG